MLLNIFTRAIKTLITIVVVLIFIGALVSKFERLQCKKMLETIENDDIKQLEFILKFANPNSRTLAPGWEIIFDGSYEKTPLQAACHKGNLEMVKLLVENGADVNYTTGSTRISALMWAVQSESSDNLKIVKYLIKNGADVEYSCTGKDAVYCLLYDFTLPPNGMEILKELVAAGTQMEEIHLQKACYWKHEEAIRYLIEECGFDASDEYYLHAYCYGVNEYSRETFEYFLQRGADPYAKNEDGKWAIYYLEKEDVPEWAEILTELAAEYGYTE